MQKVSREFYLNIVPRAMWRLMEITKFSRLTLFYHFLAEIREDRAGILIDEMRKDIAKQFSYDYWHDKKIKREGAWYLFKDQFGTFNPVLLVRKSNFKT